MARMKDIEDAVGEDDVLPLPRAPLARSRDRASTCGHFELDVPAERPFVIGTVDADVANARLHAERVQQAVVVVRIAIRLVRRQVEAIRALDQIELVDREGHDAVAVDLGRLEFLEVGVGAVDADVVGVEEAEAEHEVGDRFLGRHFHADLDRSPLWNT